MKTTKRILSLLLVALLTFSGFAISANAATTTITGGNSIDTATNIPGFSTQYISSLDTAGEKDWFKFTTLTDDAYYTISLTNDTIAAEGKDWNVQYTFHAILFDSEGKQISVIKAGYSCTESVSIKLNRYEIYYLEMKTGSYAANCTGTYEFNISFKYDVAPNEMNEAAYIPIGTNNICSLDGYADSDWYKFVAPITGTYTFTLINDNINAQGDDWSEPFCLNFYFYNRLERRIGYNKAARNVKKEMSIDLTQNELYYIKVCTGSQALSATGYYEIMINANTSINNCTVNFDPNGGTISTRKAVVCVNTEVILPTPTRYNYECIGWAESSSSTSVKYKCGDTFVPSSNTTLYAIWKSLGQETTSHTVTFNANGGSVSPSNVSVGEGLSVILPTPTKEGYTCLGWSTSSSASSAKYACGESYQVNSNITFYAVWEQNKPEKIDTSIEINYKGSYTIGYNDFTPVEYYTSNPTVATVSNNGTIYGASCGTAYVHAVDANGNEKVTEVNVNYSVIQWIIIFIFFGWIWY